MAKNVIQILISADDKASKQMKTVGKSTEKLSKQLAGVATKIAAVGMAVGAALGAVVYKTAKHNDLIAKQAKQLGVSTEFLSEYEHAVQLSGGELSDFTTGLKRLSRAASDANFGLQTYVRTFDSLGITVRDTGGNLKDTEILFDEVVVGLSRLENDTRRTAIAQELFGRGGLRLIPMLKAGTDGIEAMRQEARELGISLTQDAAKRSEDFIDSLTRLKASLRGTGMALTEHLIEPITEYIDMIATEVIPKTAEWIGKNEESIVTWIKVAAAVTTLSLGLAGIVKLLAIIQAHPVLAALTALVGLIVLNIETAPKSMKDVEEATSEASKEVWNANENVKEFGESVETLGQQTDRMFNEFMDGKTSLREWNDEVSAGKDAVDQYNETLETENEKIQAIVTRLQALKSQMELVREEAALGWEFDPETFTYMRTAGQETKETTESIVTDLEDMPERVDQVGSELESIFHSMDMTGQDVAASISMAFADAFTSMIGNAGSMYEIMMRMIKDLIRQLIRMGLQMMIFRAIMPTFFAKGGEVLGHVEGGYMAQRGLEFVGGVQGRDTIPAVVQKGEVVIPSPTVDRLNEWMDRNEGRSERASLMALFYTGSREEAYKAAEYIERQRAHYNKFIIEGDL